MGDFGPEHRTGETKSVRIEIHGDIMAGRRQIFASFRSFIGPSNIDDVTSPPAGMILLVGDRIREAYPEWWGAVATAESGPVQGPINAAAIQNAIEAAWRGRVSPRRTDVATVERATNLPGAPALWNRRPAIPLVMMGQYYVDREILIDATSTPDEASLSLGPRPDLPFELIGERGAGTPGAGLPSMRAAPAFPRVRHDESLLRIRGPLNFSIRDITFDAAFSAPRCVTVEAVAPAWSTAMFDGCSFIQALGVHMSLDAESRRIELDSPPTSAAVSDFWNVSLTRCRFLTSVDDAPFPLPPPPPLPAPQPSPPNDQAMRIRAGVIRDREFNVVCAEVRLADNQGLEFRDCWFNGPASPAIRAISGRFALNECLTHIVRPYRLGPPLDRGTPGPLIDSTIPLDYAHGADIVVDTPGTRLNRLSSRGVRVAVPASLTMREHQSHSWALCVCKRLFPEGGSLPASRRSPYVFLNVKARVEMNKAMQKDEIEPPSIFWSGSGPGMLGSPLILVGCTLPGDSRRFDRTLGISNASVLVQTGVQGLIYNIGNDVFHISNRALIRTRLVFTKDESFPLNSHIRELLSSPVDA